MAVSATLLCELLASRLNAIVPEGFSVMSQGGFVWVKSVNFPSGSGTGVASIVEQDVGDPVSNVALAAYNALSSVQDFVSEEMRWPWPPTPGKSRGYMAMPWTMLEDGKLLMGYGEAGELTLTIEPIALRDIDEATRARD